MNPLKLHKRHRASVQWRFLLCTRLPVESFSFRGNGRSVRMDNLSGTDTRPRGGFVKRKGRLIPHRHTNSKGASRMLYSKQLNSVLIGVSAIHSRCSIALTQRFDLMDTFDNTMSVAGFRSKLLKCEEAASILGLSKGAFWARCRSGEIPHIRLSQRSYRVRVSDLETYLAARTR